MEIVKISRKGQVVIPVELRRKLGVRPGDRFEVWIEGETILLKPLRRPSEGLKGIGLTAKERLGLTSTELVDKLRSEDSEEE